MTGPRLPESRSPEIPVGARLESVLALAYRARRAVLLEGSTGIGKSEIVQHVAAKLGIGTAVLDLSLLEPPDLVGLPIIENGRTEYALPKILPRDGAGILMLEELNRAERYIQQPALQLLTARRIHEYVLPAGWVCFAAINPESSEYQVTPLDTALRGRFLNLRVRADRASWLAWAREHGVHASIVALAQAHDRMLDEVSPRSWTYVSQLLQHATSTERADETVMRDALGGYLPPVWCELVMATRDRWSESPSVDVRDVLNAYAPGTAAANAIRLHRERGETDRLDEITHRVLGVLQGPEIGVLVAQRQFSLSSFEAFIADLPGDHRERLQNALAQNPVAMSLVEIQPIALLQNFAGSTAERDIRAWRADPTKLHRIALALTGLRLHLDRHPKPTDLRRDNIVRINLGLVLSQLPERMAMPLVETLIKLGITPVKPP